MFKHQFQKSVILDGDRLGFAEVAPLATRASFSCDASISGPDGLLYTKDMWAGHSVAKKWRRADIVDALGPSPASTESMADAAEAPRKKKKKQNKWK